jgi:hypothetical protein
MYYIFFFLIIDFSQKVLKLVFKTIFGQLPKIKAGSGSGSGLGSRSFAENFGSGSSKKLLI